MKKYKFIFYFLAIFLTAGMLESCVKDKLTTTYTLFRPVYKNKTAVLQSITSSTPQPLANPGKLFKYGNYIFVNEINKGVHIIDNSNPARPVNKYFIAIPGNIDIAVKGNTLYADIYTDLVAIDISNPQQVVLMKTIAGIFEKTQYQSGFIADTSQYITDWIKYQTTSEQDYLDNKSTGIPDLLFLSYPGNVSGGTKAQVSGISGSMARFTIVNNYLYTVGTESLSALNISNTNSPVLENTKYLGWNIETIYPLHDNLFIGSQTGMTIYTIANPVDPQFTSNFSHACFRDPVIADDHYAYITLRDIGEESPCRGGTAAQRNELDIVDISNIAQPFLVKIFEMAEPKGLSKDGIYLFICDGKAGLKIYDATSVTSLQLIKQIENINPYDVIAETGLAVVVADKGIYQYDYSDISNIKLISNIPIAQ